MIHVESVEDQITSLTHVIPGDKVSPDVCTTLKSFFNKLDECLRAEVKRSKERCLDEAVQLLRKIPVDQLESLDEKHLHLLIKLLLAMQLQTANISTASRKLDQMLVHLAKVNQSLVFGETRRCIHAIVDSDQTLSSEDLQRACMFLEDSAAGREVWRGVCPSLLGKVADLFPCMLEQEAWRNGPLCYLVVKVCLQIFQLLPGEVAPLVWGEERGSPALQSILQCLMDIILGKCSNRDTRLLAGTAVAMLINTAPKEGTPEEGALEEGALEESGGGGAAAWSLLQVCLSEVWVLAVGGVQVQCRPRGQDGVERLAVSRGLLTCCRKDILVSPGPSGRPGLDTPQSCFLLDGLFHLVSALCEEKLDCHYYVFEVLTLWLKSVRATLAEIWKVTAAPLLSEDSSLQTRLTQVIWNNAESPVEGVSEFVRSAFSLLLEVYEMDCQRFGDTHKTLYASLLDRVAKLPWGTKAKYPPLCALLPYLGTHMVLVQYSDLPDHLLKCLSTNQLSPCATELYRCLLQQQRRELCEVTAPEAPPTELQMANRWAAYWRPYLLEALMSDVPLVQTNSSTHLLPCTLRTYPAAVEPLLAHLNPTSPQELHAWACVVSVQRATSGASPWNLEGPSSLDTLQLALGSADDKVRLAALDLLCCCPRTREPPRPEELALLKAFIPQNLNSDSSPFRQHLQARVRKLLVRVRDSCLALLRRRKGGRVGDNAYSADGGGALGEGVGFVEWLSQLPCSYLAPGHSFQRKKTVLLLLAAVLETCTDTWSPDRRKGQPPVNMASLIDWARQRGLWDFFSRSKQLVLIGCLEDSTNEIRELAADLLARFFPGRLHDDVVGVVSRRAEMLVCSPRVPQAQTGALMMKVLLQKCGDRSQVPWQGCSPNPSPGGQGVTQASSLVLYLLKELDLHYQTAKADMMLAAKTRPIHGVLSALERCLLEAPGSLGEALDRRAAVELLGLLEDITQLLLGALYGEQHASAAHTDVPPSLSDMGRAIGSLVAQRAGDGEECVLLSEEHSLVLTCCWVALKGIGIFLGSLVERLLTGSTETACFFTLEDMRRASKIFQDILLKCRHWGAVEGCCVGFTRFCASLLGCWDPELRAIPAHMLQQGLQVVQSPRGTSVTRRAAGLPMLILCVVSAEEASMARPLLAHSVNTLLGTASAALPQDWDPTLDLPQVSAVHTLQALVRSSGLGVAVLQFASSVAILSLTLLSSPCWAMRNAALQLYSSLCSRMLGQRSGGEQGCSQHSMSPQAFFTHYPALKPFLLGELKGAAGDLQGPSGEARLRLHPSLYPVLTLLAKLQPGVPDHTGALASFQSPLLQLASSPVYSVRVMAADALVAMTPPSEYLSTLLKLTGGLPASRDVCCHNRLHGALLQTKALLERAIPTHSVPLGEVVRRVESRVWLVTGAQRCPLVAGVFLGVAGLLKGLLTGGRAPLREALLEELRTPRHRLQVGTSSFHQSAINFLCVIDTSWACQVWEAFPTYSPDLKLSLVSWVAEGQSWRGTSTQQMMVKILQASLQEALSSQSTEYSRTYLTALVAVMMPEGDPPLPQEPPASAPQDEASLLGCVELLLGLLEEHRGGPEFLSQALTAASLLLSQSLGSSLFPRWCGVLEELRAPEAPEAMRAACALALCLAGGPLLSASLRDHAPLPSSISTRVIHTGLHLLLDQSLQVCQSV
ncbi:thyroid adenoma-associated protein homolog isoform X3 [Hypomesus transpacificus]|uniref:thyroid adenoma-associated protein homolog isoform X3 n=1 Tax=Hypomesus transpacificus TaxID=137520 RepID=UPI001F076919|nr:thyroid adenoma-associated protein homolog isoform X3 [Hypomesus transpacificus]